MFRQRPTPKTFRSGLAVDEAFKVHFPNLDGFLTQGFNFNGSLSGDQYLTCQGWFVEVGDILHVRCPEQNKDLDERVILVLAPAGPEGFLRGYSFCKHEPSMPVSGHWHAWQPDLNRRHSFNQWPQIDPDKTLAIDLDNGWRLAHDMSINIALPFLFSFHESHTKVSRLGRAHGPNFDNFREAVAYHASWSTVGNSSPRPGSRAPARTTYECPSHLSSTSHYPPRRSFSTAPTLHPPSRPSTVGQSEEDISTHVKHGSDEPDGHPPKPASKNEQGRHSSHRRRKGRWERPHIESKKPANEPGCCAVM